MLFKPTDETMALRNRRDGTNERMKAKLMGIAWDRAKELQRNAFPTDGRNIPPPTISGEGKADFVLEAEGGRAAI
ncbi:hypothetical protein niasHS_003815 [Heterodera schachtii]|uniref:Uncharacterized protein n=1 Tax=Heterodera schachtii TaxID=97005 RepID=A0ABD2K3B7_HETSC